MTREEAIECLNFQNEKFFGGQSEALKIAISALSEKGWKFYYDHGYAQAKRDLSENKTEWIPISSINEIPKEGAYWVTFEYENGYRETSHIGWDKFHGRWDDEEGWALDDGDYIIAYMPYFEPKPYNSKEVSVTNE